MPYKSEAQRRYFNSKAGKAKIGAEEVEHWNEVSKGKELPEKVEDNMNFKKTMDKAIRLCRVKDASRGHEIIVRTENYLRSIGKNNSTGKYDKVVRGVKSLLEEGFLQGSELDKAIQREADRLLKKYNPNDAKLRKSKDAKPFKVTKVLKTAKSANGDTYYIVQDDSGHYVVTSDKTGNGGGVFEFSKANAERTLNSWLKIDSLEKKYGKSKGYEMYLAGKDGKPRKARDMGRSVKAENIPAHQAYHPEITPQQFQSYIKNIVSHVNNNKDVDVDRELKKIEGYISTVEDDYKADIKNKDLDKTKTNQYYRKYVQVIDAVRSGIKNREFKAGLSFILSKFDKSIRM